jgi:tripartite ATP-independent transporter DctP family solute receptor
MLVALAVLAACAPCPAAPGEADSGKPDLVFRFALQPDPANKAWEAANLMKQELERRSNGKIKILFYDSGVLGAERQILETCYLGVIEMVQCTSSVYTTLDPRFSMLDLPYIFLNEEHHQRVMNGPVGQRLLDGLRRHRLQGIGFYTCGSRNMFISGSKRPIHKPEDLAGLKIRVMESPVMIQSLRRFGASATPLSASELYTALKTGVVDGAENNPQVFVSARYTDSCKFYSKTRHFANQHAVAVNLKWFESLKPEYRTLIQQVARDIVPEYNRRWDAAVEEAMEEMVRRGVKINDVSDEDIELFQEKVRPIYDEFASQGEMPELVRLVREEWERMKREKETPERADGGEAHR